MNDQVSLTVLELMTATLTRIAPFLLVAGTTFLTDSPHAYCAQVNQGYGMTQQPATSKLSADEKTTVSFGRRSTDARHELQLRTKGRVREKRSRLVFAGNSAPDAIGQLLQSMSSPRPLNKDIDAIKSAIRYARHGKVDIATAHRDRIRDVVGRKVVEWTILRSYSSAIPYARYHTFMKVNPSWPSRKLFRRRAEARLWSEGHTPAVVLSFFSKQEPMSGLGKLVLASALSALGDHVAARKYVRSAWHHDNFPATIEARILKDFGSWLVASDHKTRMDVRLYANDFPAALRAGKRLGRAYVAIVSARRAVKRNASNARALLNAVPMSVRGDPAYLLTRIEWLRRNDEIETAVRLMRSAPRKLHVVHNADVWWIERRTLVRELLDRGKTRTAYRIAQNAALPSKESLRVDLPFTAGWIALRFLHDPVAAAQHFLRIPRITTHPTSLARAEYWLGRAAESANRPREARGYYESAAKRATAYYGQLAAARISHRTIFLRQPPTLSSSQRIHLRNADLVRAVELLYATGNRDLVTTFVADLDRVRDIGILTLIAETTAKHKDARASLSIGRSAIARGLAFDHYAFPRIGLPNFAAAGRRPPASLVYAIARAESAFNPNVVSAAKAIGLMQVTPAAGRTIARRSGIKFDLNRLQSDPAYNLKLGAAELTSLVSHYDKNYVMVFVGYNAGRGRVKQWIERYGDPRESGVDVIDWVERIPFTETRIYVQRVMENLQVYRSLLHRRAPLTIEADMRGRR